MTIILSMLKSEVHFLSVKGTGPGGQNVNKRNTTAILVWQMSQSAMLTDGQKLKLKQRLRKYFNKNGEITLRAGEFRSLDQNKRSCVEKLKFLIISGLKDKKKRIQTHPTRASTERRHQAKKIKSEKKKMRQKVSRLD